VVKKLEPQSPNDKLIGFYICCAV